MAALIFCIGAVALVSGAVMVGYGIPDSEFSFGNTLIVAGVTTASSGLIVMALGVVVMKLQQVAAGFAATMDQDSIRLSKPNGAPGKRPHFSSKTESLQREMQNGEPAAQRAEAKMRGPAAHTSSGRGVPAQSSELFKPALANPERAYGVSAKVTNVDKGRSGEGKLRPSEEKGWLGEAASESRLEERGWPGPATSESLSVADRPSLASNLPERSSASLETDLNADRWQEAAVLKSGVIDGMRYTLYTDGSIEAELPQGILRFASVSDLRGHLEKTS